MGLQNSKTDPELGAQIQALLIETGIETPMDHSAQPTLNTPERKILFITDRFKEIMQALDLNLKDDSLRDTASRVAKMYVNEIFWGLNYNNFPKCTAIKNKMQVDEMVIERKISVQSNCEHHFVVIDGLCDIAYIPDKHVLGLSKMNRVVEFFSKRPQVQERLTVQIYEALAYILGTKDVAVRIKANHYCVKSRGVEDVNSDTITTKLGGKFKKEGNARAEFLSMINSV